MPKSKLAVQKPDKITQVVVVGTSAGGLNALIKLTSQLQPDFPAPVLVVQHISADATGDVLLDNLKNNCRLTCLHAVDKADLLPGHLYLAPSDHHLMVSKGAKIMITKGAHENRSRPAVDPLFRSAAVAFTNGVIGILLTGYLDDGTAGLKAIQQCGGVCIIQEPGDAQYPDMPQNALNQLKPDYCLPIAEMGGVLYQLVSRKLGRQKTVPKDISIEARIAERVLSDLPAVNALGEQVPFNCPGCGGVLWKVDSGLSTRFRCHTGHAYTAEVLLAEQTGKIEETMWVALRMFEERKNLLTTMSKELTGSASRIAAERVTQSEIHIARIKNILIASETTTNKDQPT
jgi:two-component system chemotaxis response regulator CheB